MLHLLNLQRYYLHTMKEVLVLSGIGIIFMIVGGVMWFKENRAPDTERNTNGVTTATTLIAIGILIIVLELVVYGLSLVYKKR